jgi:hypothetical protein
MTIVARPRRPSGGRGIGLVRIFRLSGFREALLLRGALVWLSLRLAAAFFGIVDANTAVKLLILGTVAIVVYLDARRRDEDLFLANLGISGPAISVAALPVPLLAELLAP